MLTNRQLELLKFIDKNGFITHAEGIKFWGQRANFCRLISRLIAGNYVQCIIKYAIKPEKIYLINLRSYETFKMNREYWRARKKWLQITSIFD
jgi:hypothetical protein